MCGREPNGIWTGTSLSSHEGAEMRHGRILHGCRLGAGEAEDGGGVTGSSSSPTPTRA